MEDTAELIQRVGRNEICHSDTQRVSSIIYRVNIRTILSSKIPIHNQLEKNNDMIC